MHARDAADDKSTFRLEEYFVGPVKAWGMFQDRFGRLRRRFVVDIQGHWRGDALVLVEDFRYDDGELQQRVWHITPDGDDYRGRADDVVGIAEGRAHGPAVRWRYTFELPVGRRSVRVRFDDWMYRQDDEIVVSRARVTKLGIRLGEVTICFRKLPVVAARPARPRLEVA